MRPSSYHDRNRYVNKPLIINNTSQTPSDSLLPHARLITNTTPSILRPQVRHNSYYYQPAIIHSRNNRSSYSSSYHHHRNTYSHRNTHHSYHRSRNRGRIHHRSHNRYNEVKSHNNRSRSRNRNKKNKSILDNRFSSSNINDISSKNELKSKVIESRNEFFNKYQLTFNKYYNDIIISNVNNYYNKKLNPRFMIENDTKFRNRIERFKGLNAYPFNDFMDFDENKNNKPKNKSAIKTKNTLNKEHKHSKNDKKSGKKKDDKSIFSSKGKSSMNYKFRAFKKSSQPNSFVQSENETNANVTRNMRSNMMRSNIHVNDDDIYIGRDDGIDMNELINGLVYSTEYQDYRIGTSNTAQNDYSQYFVDTRQRPVNFIRELEHIDRLKEYPKLRKLMQSKNEALRKISCLTPPFYINTNLKTFDLLSLQTKFDVILVDPPWKFYVDRCPGYKHDINAYPWTFQEMSDLRIQDVAENPSFLFLWSGSGKTLNDGRLLLKKWGYKRCEVIVWLKTNKKNQIRLLCKDKNFLLEKNNNGYVQNEYEGKNYEKSLFVRSYEHCLMGIRGQVRRSTDGHLIHANVDTDVIITESAPYGSEMKPNELYDIIERFCLGRKRLELFGCKHNLRPGWLTISNDKGIPLNSNYDPAYYNSLVQNNNNQNSRYVPSTNEIEALRPKSPVRNNQKNKNNNQSKKMI